MYVLLEEWAGFPAVPSTRKVVARSKDRASLLELKRELDTEDEAHGHFSTCRWVERARS